LVFLWEQSQWSRDIRKKKKGGNFGGGVARRNCGLGEKKKGAHHHYEQLENSTITGITKEWEKKKKGKKSIQAHPEGGHAVSV